jgi:hypothetical protein
VGLTGKEYCIFNKQYTKEEYEELLPKIIQQMNDVPYLDEQGRVYRYGEFFPFDFCPFGYNETSANYFFPISKEEAIAKGYPWKDREERNYNVTLFSKDLPESIAGVGDDICNQVIECPNKGKAEYQCTEAFRIVPAELNFYRQKNLPLPHFCPNCRHYMRIRKYNISMHLSQKQCNCDISTHGHAGVCQNEFKTTYSPSSTKKIYCESCYNKEIY